MTFWFRVGVVTLALAATACGNEDSPGEKAFGELNSRDETQLDKWQRDFRRVPEANVQVVRAFNGEDVAGARRGVDRFNTAMTDAADATIEFDNPKLRRVLQGYVEPFEHYGLTLERFVTAWEQEVQLGVPAQDTVVNDLLEDLQAAAEATRRADRRLINRLLDVMSPDQRSELRREVRRWQQRFDAQVAP